MELSFGRRDRSRSRLSDRAEAFRDARFLPTGTVPFWNRTGRGGGMAASTLLTIGSGQSPALHAYGVLQNLLAGHY